MKEQTTDRSVLKHIKGLAAEEHRLFQQDALSKADAAKLKKLQIELDQCWDLLRQRQAKRSVGQDPNQAHVRSAKVVENYEQ